MGNLLKFYTAVVGLAMSVIMMPASAATVSMYFTGTLSDLSGRPINSIFFNPVNGNEVTGRVDFDISKQPSDPLSDPDQSVYADKVGQPRVDWVDFNSDQLEFSKEAVPVNRTSDKVSVRNNYYLGSDQFIDQLGFVDNASSDTSGLCNATKTCWQFTSNAQSWFRLNQSTFSGDAFPQPFDLTDFENQNQSIKYILSNKESAVGTLGFEQGYIKLTSLSFNVAPVPLPAAGWMFVSALVGGIVFARNKKDRKA